MKDYLTFLQNVEKHGFKKDATRLQIGGKFQLPKVHSLGIPVLKSSELRSKNKTGLCCSMPSGGSLSAGAPGTPDPGAGTYK